MTIETAILNSLTTTLDDKVYVIDRQYSDDYPTDLSMALLARIDQRKNNVGYTFTYAVILMDDQGNTVFGESFEDTWGEVVEHRG
tara:strand:+ start:487 stop:741 length:255 start_codon:yes stop_codon:yes gene_type:complete